MSKVLHRHRKKENTIQILQFDTYFLNVDFPSIHLFHHTIEGKAAVDIVSIVIEKVSRTFHTDHCKEGYQNGKDPTQSCKGTSVFDPVKRPFLSLDCDCSSE